MKLELKHIAGYLPYKVNVQITEQPLKNETHKLTGINYDGLASLGDGGMFGFIQRGFKYFKPILRPLSDLTKEIEHNGETFVPLIKYMSNFFGEPEEDFNEFEMCDIEKAYLSVLSNYNMRTQQELEFLYEHHFDVNGLIESGLAIDINTLTK